MRTDIIIPTFGQEDFTVQCLKSIKKHTKTPYRIVWVDNGSVGISRDKVMSELVNHQYLTIWFSSPVGFIKAVNAGLKAMDADYAVILNNDTVATPEWLTRLIYPFTVDNRIGVTGPFTSKGLTSWQAWDNVKKGINYPTKHLTKSLYGGIPDLTNKSDEDISNLLSQAFNNQYKEVHMLAFFCACVSCNIVKKIGLLDESFGVGYGDDDDYCQRIIQHGYKVVHVPSSFVHHYHHATFNQLYTDKERQVLQSKNLKHFKNKHNIR